jgi:hypothetical protein
VRRIGRALVRASDGRRRLRRCAILLSGVIADRGRPNPARSGAETVVRVLLIVRD